jgi:iron-sulfur cluster repair protein YtfE (RIC family)
VTLISCDYHVSMMLALDAVLAQLGAGERSDDDYTDHVLEEIVNLRAQLAAHVEKEKQLLFPLFQASGSRDDSIKPLLKDLRYEHRKMEELFTRLSHLTNEYNGESSAAPSQKLAYAQLNELEQDFNRAIFVEEEYLFPRLSRH